MKALVEQSVMIVANLPMEVHEEINIVIETNLPMDW